MMEKNDFFLKKNYEKVELFLKFFFVMKRARTASVKKVDMEVGWSRK